MCRGDIVFLVAAAALVRAERLPIRNYTASDGLPHDSVSRIRRDSYGYLWFCTPAGLARFDGSQFVTYNSGRGLPDQGITDIREDKNGTYWVATGGAGVFRLRPWADGEAATGYSLGAHMENYVQCLYVDSSGRLWAGTEFGLFVKDRGGSVFRNKVAGITVFAILEDRHNAVLIGSSAGL